jgi:hypothetical protein
MAFQHIHSAFPAIFVAFQSAFQSGARAERAQHTVAVLRVLGTDRGRAVAFRHIHTEFPAISVAVPSPLPSHVGPASTQHTDAILTALSAGRDHEGEFRRIHAPFFAFVAAVPSHFRSISKLCRPGEHPVGPILRILWNSHTILPETPMKQLAQRGFRISEGAREARQHAGLWHIPQGRLTLNQRVQGSSPWGLTTTTSGSETRSHY